MSDDSFEKIVESVLKNSKKTIAKEVQDRFVTRRSFHYYNFCIILWKKYDTSDFDVLVYKDYIM